MLNDVKQCFDSRVNFFGQYYTVPAEVQPEVDAFINEIVALGERSQGAAEFEAAFASSGLSERFTGLLTRCTPKPYQMNEQEKAYVREVKKEMFEENKEQLVKDVASDVADSIMMKAESDAIAGRRKAMI